jgi:transcriptional regulator with XRE-family HTH domain
VSLATRLKELRLRSRRSLQQVADAVGASKAHIWELETGKSAKPSLELVKRLADHFSVTLASLVGEDPNAPDEDEELLVMWREIKGLDPKDRETLSLLIRSMRERRRKEPQDAD